MQRATRDRRTASWVECSLCHRCYDPPMPLIRCEKCGQGYDVPGAVAVHLPNSIATCHCGEWIAGSKAALLARMLNPAELREIDLQHYRLESSPRSSLPVSIEAMAPGKPRSVRVAARTAGQSLNKVFTIGEHP